MDDKIISPPDTAEYKYAESEGVPTEAPVDMAGLQASDSSNGFSIKNINWHKFIAPVVIVLGILLLYGVSNFYNAKKSSGAEQKKAQAQEVVAAQQKMISESPPISVTQSKPLSSTLLNNDQIEQLQTVVQQKMSAVEHEISNNQDQFLSLGDAVSKAQQDISSVNQNVNQLTMTMQQLLLEVQQLKALKNKPKKKAVKPTLTSYHVRAIVPGRVWLESDDGKNNVTLRVGDRLGDYGTVDVISPQQGMVLMSNGAYFQYGANDF